MHNAPEHHSSSSRQQQQHQAGVAVTLATIAGAGAGAGGAVVASAARNTTNTTTTTAKMATSSMESIGQKLHVLEKRLEEENNSHHHIMFGASGSAAPNAAGRSNMGGDGIGLPGSRTPRPNLSALESTPNRSSMRLPVMSSTNRNAPATEMQNKLKMIRNKSGILTINRIEYPSKMSDLEHVSDLGNGTSGNVVKMRHKPTGTIIAVKQMRGTGNKEENNRILMDLDVILNSHDCPNIVHCLGYFVNGPDVWICMELMSMCFDKLLKLSKRPVPENILGKVTVATVRALSYLKVKHNVIHRDVKPSNILIDERGKIKLCDFGISGRLVDSKANTRSAGCAAYMAPERIDPKKPEYDIRADVWSLGITLVELATGRSPYEGCNIDFEVLTKILDNEPPSLPYGDGIDFTQEFREFVDKCLTKDYVYRPKYPELLQQPFFRYYDAAEVDVAQWFKTVVESAAIETHRTHMPATTTTAISTLRGDATANSNSKHNRNANTTTITIPLAATVIPAAAHATSTMNTKMTAATIATATATSHIPSYQNLYHSGGQQQQQQQINLSRYKRDEYPPQYHPHSQLHQQQQQPHYPHAHAHQPSQLPQPIASYYNNTANNHLQGERGGGGGGGGSVGGNGNGYGGVASSNTSPQSPPSSYNLQHKDDAAHIVSEMNKLYCKSPFLQRKYSNGGKYASGTGVESPKKESMFSSIGQSIIRNLTTSPFSQKKHHNTPQPHQVDPLWRMPNVHDTGGIGVGNAFDICDATTAAKAFNASPMATRKRYQYNATTNVPLGACDIKEQSPTLIPVNRNETNPQRVQGNHSPIVLQRFYHQQNQLREKELERRKEQQQQQKQFTKNNASSEGTNPFHSNYVSNTGTGNGAGVSSTQLHYANHFQLPQRQQQQQQQPQYLTHIPLGSAASSSHSTSSQSSTQSSSSQIAVSELQQQRATNLHSPPPPAPNAGAPTLAPSAFGASATQLQYQPLPQQYLPLNTETLRSSRSPPTSPEQTSEGSSGISGSGGGSSGNGVASKLGKLYARRQWQSTTATPPAATSNGGKESHGYKDEHGWFNSLAGAMKRQFASYVKLQLHSAAPATAAVPHNTDSLDATNATTLVAGKTALPYYRTMSTGSSSNTSNSTSPTEALPKQYISSSSSAGTGSGNGSSAPEFYDGSSSSFLRRYAAAGASGMTSASGAGNAHQLIGLDRRHRSPDPPPRYNRGQSPLLLRKNLLELSGQPPGSPLLNRRFVSASPPLPPPRRGSESVPGSPQHFRTRIHYTPEPQRRIYRTIDQ